MPTIRAAKERNKKPSAGNSIEAPFVTAVACVDSQDRVTLLSKPAAQLLGLRPGVKRSLPLGALPEVLREVVAETRAGKRSSRTRQITLPVARGKSVVVHLSATRIHAGQTPAAILLLFQESNASPEQDPRIRHLDRLASIGTMAAGMAHEIKNALVVGKTFFDLLMEKQQDAELVDLARRELARIDRLVSEMLRFTGVGKATFGEVRLHEVLDHSLRLVQRQLKDKAIHLERDFGANYDRMQGDDLRLEQAFVNLLLNAVEAMGPHGRLTVRTSTGPAERKTHGNGRGTAGGQLQVTIKDTGMGISKQNLERLFGPFFTTKEHGTGLGLSITRKIIQEHGGAITVKSQPNQGAAFSILLPAAGPTFTRAE